MECFFAGQPEEEACKATFEVFRVALPLQSPQQDPGLSGCQVSLVTRSSDADKRLRLGLALHLHGDSAAAQLGSHDSSVPAQPAKLQPGSIQQVVTLGMQRMRLQLSIS